MCLWAAQISMCYGLRLHVPVASHLFIAYLQTMFVYKTTPRRYRARMQKSREQWMKPRAPFSSRKHQYIALHDARMKNVCTHRTAQRRARSSEHGHVTSGLCPDTGKNSYARHSPGHQKGGQSVHSRHSCAPSTRDTPVLVATHSGAPVISRTQSPVPQPHIYTHNINIPTHTNAHPAASAARNVGA